MAQPADALVVGGGVIGLAAGYRLAERGASVTLVDSGGPGASWAAAGMLAPVTEAAFGEEELTRLNLAAVPAFRALAAELAGRTGLEVGLRTEGTLAVAFNADDRAALDRLTDFRTGLGLRTERLSGSATRALEPYLAAGVRGGVLAADDLSVDNRRYLDVLRAAAGTAGVRFVTAEVGRLLRDRAGRVTGVRTTTGEELPAGTVVLCGGAATAALLPVPVLPVKGQILRLAVPARLRSAGEVLTRTVRGLVRGGEIYLVPRAGGEVVVGATSEQQGHDTQVTAGGVYELLRNAYELLPISSEFRFVEARAGSRPGTPDNGPILGRVADGLVLATGHYRNGILLSALTADAVAALAVGEPVAAVWHPFGPDRFAVDRPAGLAAQPAGPAAQPAVPA